MKIDVITLNAIRNYGSVLQALATQELLVNHGTEVEIINYIREDALPQNIAKTYGGESFIKRMVMLPTIIRWKYVFDKFQKKHLNLSEKIYTTEEDFKSYPLNADAYCTGSDQVWNSVWNKGIIKPLYLSFVPKNCFKFSFASSFGQDRVSEDEIFATKDYINQYNHISVREASGKRIIEEQYNFPKAIHLIDPTLCLPADFWRKYSSKRKIKKEYILIYNLNKSKDFDNYAKQLSKKTGLKLIRLCTRYDQFYRVGKSILVPKIEDFISLIDNATYVLTDSFHATAFSMNMNTEPICIYPNEFGGRLDSFLNLVDSKQRHVKSFEDFDVINRKTDFEKVNNVLDVERNKANSYIKSVINEIKGE